MSNKTQVEFGVKLGDVLNHQQNLHLLLQVPGPLWPGSTEEHKKNSLRVNGP